uniref:Fibrinogen C-terminal domain-containing protein n=1 Tax=Magallana gigas TaxID=29159 RepID=A0A8W8JPP0_MAGGI
MGRHIELLILILLLKSTKEQVLFDDLDDSQQTSKESAMHFIRNELQQIRQSVMKILLQKLEDIKDELNRKISTEIENVTKTIVENFTETLENKLTCFSHSTLISGFDCSDILKRCPNTKKKDGVYNISNGSNKIKAVYCDMTTDNGGWTVSSVQPQELRVDMERFNGEKAYAVYSTFSVGNEASKYILQVNEYVGTAGDSLSYSNNSKFSTPDQDNDAWSSGNCATRYRSAGWFSTCFLANPNGQYTDSEEIANLGYVSWYHWKNSWISLKLIQLMSRPRA